MHVFFALKGSKLFYYYSVYPRVVRTNKPDNSMHIVAHVQHVG